jgi:hypothetical protein
MANLTITVKDDTLKRARIKAIERGESVNSYLAEMLSRYAGDKQRVMGDLAELSAQYDSGNGGRAWSREDLQRS